jgi:bis(5'-nucleosidyl)-tetraphosphatase
MWRFLSAVAIANPLNNDNSKTAMKEKSCGAIVRNKDKYLLLHYNAGHWDFPKGHIEKNETEEETAKRELMEETGISASKTTEGFKERIAFYYNFEGQNRFKEVTYFLMETKETAITLSHEHKGYAWLTYDEAMKKLTFDNAKNVLLKANAFSQDRS